jgi:modification methylase
MTDRPSRLWEIPQPPGDKPPIPLLSLWPTGQSDHATQLRDSGCVPGTEADTDQIPPAIAARAITTYTDPGELVLDPDCGTGTVLTEALRAGRHALGLTDHPRWWTIARANVSSAKRNGAWGDGSVLDARPQLLATIRAAGLVGRVGLILTALRTATGDNPSDPDLDSAFNDLHVTAKYCEPLLRSGGHLVVVARPQRRPDGSLADLITGLIAAGTSAGFVPIERCVALTAALRGGRLVTRASIEERRTAVQARAAGAPIALWAHDEVIVFQLAHEAELAAAAASQG